MSRRGIAAAVALVGVFVLGGCGSATGPKAAVPPPSTSAGPGGTPDALVGMWRVSGAAGEPAGSVLRLSVGEGLDLLLFRSCGYLLGDWAASPSGLFVGMTSGASMSCSGMSRVDTPAWLARARAYRVTGHERDLLATNGAVLARLLPGGQVRPDPNLVGSLQRPPTLDPAQIRTLRTVPHPLPAGSTPATVTSILGRWVPYPKGQFQPDHMPYLSFSNDGSWTGSDGCNGEAGLWGLSNGGEMLTTSGPSTLVKCEGAPTESWARGVRRAGVSGNILTLYDIEGRLLARLTR